MNSLASSIAVDHSGRYGAETAASGGQRGSTAIGGNAPMVSVCLITYQHERYVQKAIDGILMQELSVPREIIVADDCSSDSTRAIILEYKNRHPGLFRLFFQETNVGGGRNFVDLLSAARGKYIAYIEGDDYWTDPMKLQKQYEFMDGRHDYSACYHKIKWVYTYPSDYDPDLESNSSDPAFSTIHDVLRRGWFIRSCSMFFRRFPLPPGFETLFVGDYPLHVLLAHRGKIGFLNETMAVYRINHQGFSEQNLVGIDFAKRRRSYLGDLTLCNYLNRHTDGAYQTAFDRRRFDACWSHLRFTFKTHRPFFIRELRDALRRFGWWFLLREAGRKVVDQQRRRLAAGCE